MKKQFISMLLVLALVICVMLAVAPTAEATSAHPHDDATQTHCVCNSTATVKGHTHVTAPTWTAWPGIANVTEGGYYYLEKNETIEWPSETVSFNLCLNGYNITQSTQLVVGNVTICDCAATVGTITSNFSNSGVNGGVAIVNADCELNLFHANLVYSGTGVKTGGCIRIESDGKFNMYSGAISGGKVVDKANQSGGNLFVNGTFNMYGGRLSNSTTALVAKDGGNIYTVGTVYITGNSVIEGGYTTYGGAVRVSGGTFTIDSGVIRNGKTDKTGGNVYVQKGNVYIKGTAVVENGNAKTNGGNIWMQGTSATTATNVYLSENAKIMNGIAGGNGSNLAIRHTNKSFFNMSGGAMIGGTMYFDTSSNNIGQINFSGGYLKLAEDITTVAAATSSKISVNAANALIIDLNGHKLSGAVNAGDKKLSIVDSTAAVAGAGTGKLEATVTGTLAQGQALPAIAGELAGKRYVTIDGVAHRIYIGVENVSLLEDGGDIGMGYTTSFKADAAIKALLSGNEAYGIEVWVEETNKVIGKKDAASFVAGASGNQVTAHVKAILKAANEKDVNKTAAETKINARTFIKLDGMDTIYSNTYSFSLQDIIDAAELKGMDKVQAENEAFYNLLAEIKKDYLPAVA